ncbi:hypothetical protein [Mycolicibacterium vanbaalenii]|uniref:hypothetical protein n=1 Tax=Mycolicibacterium vanbaalenii TaxID=110539 RepID=UPI00059BFA8A|nr:hypothetical protein [Mycolicibacterium vanbaalenii]MCV7127020.1 hypothetical protein [Mycolicibacterium vanbaalenii PYR-1]
MARAVLRFVGIGETVGAALRALGDYAPHRGHFVGGLLDGSPLLILHRDPRVPASAAGGDIAVLDNVRMPRAARPRRRVVN